MTKKEKTNFIDNIKIITTEGLLPGQDRIFVKQLKKPAHYGYILLTDLKCNKFIVHTIKGEIISYTDTKKMDAEGWVID